jgi:hypothetical protein
LQVLARTSREIDAAFDSVANPHHEKRIEKGETLLRPATEIEQRGVLRPAENCSH